MTLNAITPFIRLLLVEAVLLGIGGALGNVTQEGKAGWYENLSRSALTPPDWVFGVVWTALYLMIGFVFWRLWERRAVLPNRKIVLTLFAVQMLFNWAWTPIFFAAHMLLLSFLWLLGLVAFLLALLSVLWRVERVSAWLLMPYAMWCGFASYLSCMIWLMN